jgi:hypothetical protein
MHHDRRCAFGWLHRCRNKATHKRYTTDPATGRVYIMIACDECKYPKGQHEDSEHLRVVPLESEGDHAQPAK